MQYLFKQPLGADTVILSIVLSVFNAVLLCMAAYRSIQTLQLRGYKAERYMHWLKNTHGRYFSRLFMLCFMSASAVLVINILFLPFENLSFLSFSLIFYFIYLIEFIRNDFKYKKKTPLVFTNRIKRLIVLLFILSGFATYGLFMLSYLFHEIALGWLKFVLICFTPLITPILVLLSFVLLLPWENTHNHNFVIKAKNKLKRYPELIKIGITGSYGKTSVKNILYSMLSHKYMVLTTPSSYNTPMGLTKTILKQLDHTHEVFIAEMGARYRGDIKYICQFVNPKYGIITSVANQHLETFKTLQNIMDTKYELVECLPKDGLAVFNVDTESASQLYKRYPGEKIMTGLRMPDGFARCSNIKMAKELYFDLTIENQTVSCKSKLAGMHNLSNILICAALAYKMGVSLNDISAAISALEAVPHRLEVIYSNGINIIDDSFNANPDGAAAALEVLKQFDGKKKIIVTPGLVELGTLQVAENYKFGTLIAGAADVALLIGENQTAPIKDGLLQAGYDEKNIHIFESLDKAKSYLTEIIGKGDVVLFENDLPDNYAEHA